MKKNGMALLVAVMVALGSLSGCGVKETDSNNVEIEELGKKESVEVAANDEVAKKDNKTLKVTEVVKYESYNSDGNIVTSWEYEYDENGNQTRWIHNGEETKYEYDEYGNRIKEVEYDLEGRSFRRYRYENEYDMFGNLVKVTEYIPNGTVMGTTEYEYDMFKKLIKAIQYDSENNITSCTEVDRSKNVIRMMGYDSNGNIYILIEYDEYGNELKREEYDYNEEGIVSHKREEQRDAKGNLLKEIEITYVNSQECGIAREEPLLIEEATEIEYDANGKTLRGIRYSECNAEGKREILAKAETEFDEEGRRIRETEYGKNGNKLYMSEYTYGEDGKKIETWYDFTTGEVGNESYQCKYDKNGNQTLHVKYNSEGREVEREEWEYDESGNLIWHMLYDTWGTFEEEVWEYDENGNMSTYTKRDEGRIVEYAEYITLERESLF